MLSQNPHIDIETDLPLIPLSKDEKGQYLFPSMPCGILPFFIGKEHKIVWGCVETNRISFNTTHGSSIEIKSIYPPAGTQDLVVIKDTERFKIEVSKKFKNEFNKNFLNPFIGKNINNQNYYDDITGSINNNYQDIITCCKNNGYEVFLESMLATAAHETREEHGANFGKNGSDRDFLIKMYEFEPQSVQGKREEPITQKIYAAQIIGPTKIKLNNPLRKKTKTEDKIRINEGQRFYETGIWCTLDELKNACISEKLKPLPAELTDAQKMIIQKEFIAWESRIKLMEKIELSIAKSINSNRTKINSTVNQDQKEKILEFKLVEIGKNKRPFNNNKRMLPSCNFSNLYSEKPVPPKTIKHPIGDVCLTLTVIEDIPVNKKYRICIVKNENEVNETIWDIRTYEENAQKILNAIRTDTKLLINAIGNEYKKPAANECVKFLNDALKQLEKEGKDYKNELIRNIELENIKTEEENRRRTEEAEIKLDLLINTADELIRWLLEQDCELEYLVGFRLKFKSEQNFESLQAYTKMLSIAGLSINLKYYEDNKKIEILEELEPLVLKLSEHFSQPVDHIFSNTQLEQIKAKEEDKRRKEEAERKQKQLLNTADRLIKKLIGDHCKLETSLLHNFTIEFASKQKFESLQEYAKALTSAGLATKLQNEFTFELKICPGRLHIVEEKVETIVEKLSAYFSQTQSLRFVN